MTPRELTDALEMHAARNVPGESTAFVRVDVRLLSDAAQTLRALEAAALEYRRAVDAFEANEDGSGYRLSDAAATLDATLNRPKSKP